MILINRCNNCILPENYPGITFNAQGVCHYCSEYSEPEYLGEDLLHEHICQILDDQKKRNASYDCVLGLSGGRDSSYLLSYLVEKLGLNVLAYSFDNGFTPMQTIQNIKRMTQILNVPLILEKKNYLENCIKHHILSWMQNPSPAMIETFCIGCRYGIINGTVCCARDNQIPIMIDGGTPFEESYKINLMKYNPQKNGQVQFVLGAVLNYLKNPKFLMNMTCVKFQVLEYLNYFYRFQTRPLFGIQPDVIVFKPFKKYIRWNEKEIISTIVNKLEWQRNPDAQSTWRGDCKVALIKLFLYKKILGFNDRDVNLSHLIRSGQLTRNEALMRIRREGEIPEKVIQGFFSRLKLDYSQLEKALSKITLK